jgi:hypothetical protein
MLFLPALFIPLLALYAFERIGAKATIAVVSLMVLLNLTHTQPKGYLTYDDEYYYPASIAQKGLNTTTREENEPRWVHTRFWPTRAALIAPNSLSASSLSWTSTRHVSLVNATASAGAIDPTSYYPGWTALIDGRETPIAPTTEYGLISFTVPPGHHNVIVELRPTRIRSVSVTVSLMTLAIILLAVGAELLRVRRSKYAPHDEPTEEEKRATAGTG